MKELTTTELEMVSGARWQHVKDFIHGFISEF